MLVSSGDIQKWVYIHKSVVILVCVETHVGLSYLRSVSWQIVFRNQKFSRVKAAVHVIRIVNETEFLSPVHECEHESWM